jgi:hypothetical protein
LFAGSRRALLELFEKHHSSSEGSTVEDAKPKPLKAKAVRLDDGELAMELPEEWVSELDARPGDDLEFAQVGDAWQMRKTAPTPKSE